MVGTLDPVVANGAIVVIVPGAVDHLPFEPLALQPVTLFTVVDAVGATVVYAVVRRLSSRQDRVLAIVAAVVLFVSFVPDLAVARELPGSTDSRRRPPEGPARGRRGRRRHGPDPKIPGVSR